MSSLIQFSTRVAWTTIIAAVSVALVSTLSSAQAPQPGAPGGGTELGFGVFQQHCVSCHGVAERAVPASGGAIPLAATLRRLAPEAILEALTTRPVSQHALGLTDLQKRQVSESLSGRPLGAAGEGDAAAMPNLCSPRPPLGDPSKSPGWSGWGVDAANSRFQTEKGAGLTSAQVQTLKLRWAFGYPRGVSAFGQPAVASGRVFVGTDTGYLYALDAKTGCVHWSFTPGAAVRNAVSVGRIGERYAVFFGDLKANVYAVDASTGAQIWTTHVDDHLTARVTGSVTLYAGRLYVPISSWEEFSASALDYPCCTFRGSVVALDAATGRQVWKTFAIPEPKPVRKNTKGVQLYAPAGASIWNAPTIDAARRALYVGTGDSETYPASDTSDAVLALDLDTGRRLWSYQTLANDSFLVGCAGSSRSDNCPVVQGPDLDIPASPILRTLAGGKRVLVVATKPGDVYGLDPDRGGAVLWKVNVGSYAPQSSPQPDRAPPSAGAAAAGNQRPRRNGIQWGGAADTQNAYFGLSAGAVVAITLATGERVWYSPVASPDSRVSYSAATSAIPGVVFVGGSDGSLVAVSAIDGRKIWEFATAREFATVNKVRAHGGAISSAGAVVADGMVFVGSGYGVIGSATGNALLAFAPE